MNPTALECDGQSTIVDRAVAPTITLFAVPKPFEGSTGVIQRNAVESWKQLAPSVEVLLLGDEPGIAESAAELEVRHVPGLKLNSHGTPVLSSAFQLSHEHSCSPVLMYCNSDVILEPTLIDAIETVRSSPLSDQFVAFGRRIDVPVDWEIQFDRPADRDRLQRLVQQKGRLAPVVCKEYFAFPRAMYASVPDFAVGRGNWDNWMIHHPRQKGIPVIDLSDTVQVIHQQHGYSPQHGDRGQRYVLGAEARENQRLAGGRHIVSGCHGTWRLAKNELIQPRWPQLNLNFWRDLPRFMRLLAQLFLKRR